MSSEYYHIKYCWLRHIIRFLCMLDNQNDNVRLQVYTSTCTMYVCFNSKGRSPASRFCIWRINALVTEFAICLAVMY